MPELIRDLTLFVLVVGGWALPFASLLPRYSPLERMCLGLGTSIVLLYLSAFALYLSGLSWNWLWVLPWFAWAATWWRRAAIRAWAADPTVRTTAADWMLLSAWCLGWHVLVFSYSGGGWAGDWFEHFERARFFVFRWPLDHLFIGVNALPARPPLANLTNAGLMGLAGDGFAHFQVFSTLFSSLVLFPLAALTQRRGTNHRVIHVITLLLMLSPLLVQNATFPWTKLPAAFFVLVATVMLLRSLDQGSGHGWAGLMLAAGLLVHYSVAPWIIALGAAWGWSGRRSWIQAGYRRELWVGALLALGLLSTWLGWAAYHYGPGELVQATSTVGLAPSVSWGGRLVIALRNIGNTFVPDWNSPVLLTLLRQADQWSRMRDLWFCFYQHNLLLACGLGNLAALIWLLTENRTRPTAPFWWITGLLAVVIGVIVHTTPVDLGVTHICLQPLVLLALAWVAVQIDHLPRWLRLLWGCGLVADLILGVGLHFGVQSLYLQAWTNPGLNAAELMGRSASTAMLNYHGKLNLHQPFLFDLLAGKHGLVVILLVCLLALAWVRWREVANKFVSPQGPASP